MFRNAALPGCNNLVRVTHILYYTMIITKFIFSTLFQNIQPLIKHCNNITLIIIHILIFTIIHNIMLKHEIQISKFLETFSAVPVYIYMCSLSYNIGEIYISICVGVAWSMGGVEINHARPYTVHIVTQPINAENPIKIMGMFGHSKSKLRKIICIIFTHSTKYHLNQYTLCYLSV